MLSAILLLGCPTPPPETKTEPLPDPVCAEGAFFDGTSCVAEACGTAPYGDATGDVYVDAAAAPDGDGSAERPFLTFAEALAAAPDGTIVLAAGRYEGSYDLTGDNKGISVLGRCADLVLLDAAGAADVFRTTGRASAAFSLAGLSFSGATEAPLYMLGGEVTARDLVLNGGRAAIYMSGDDAALVLSNSTLSGSPTAESEGLWVETGATATLADVTISQTTSAALDVSVDATVTGTGVTIHGVSGVDGYGFGIYAVSGAMVDLTDVEIMDTSGVAVFAYSDRTMVTLTDARVGSVAPSEDGGVGLWAQDGGTITARDTTVQDTSQWGVTAIHDGHLVLEDVLVTRVAAEGGTRDAGVAVADEGTLQFDGLVIDSVSYIGIASALGTVDGTDLTVSNLAPIDGGIAAGILAASESVVDLREVTLDGSWSSAVAAYDASTVVEIQGLVAGGPYGESGLSADLGGHLACTDCVFDGVQVLASAEREGSRVDLEGLEVGSVESGLDARTGGTVTMSDATFNRLTGWGAVADGVGSVVDISGWSVFGDSNDEAVAAIALSGGLVRIEGSELHQTGVVAVAAQLQGARVELTDTQIGAEGEWMRGGVQIVIDATASLSGVSFTDVADLAVLVSDPGASVEMDAVTVTNVRRTADYAIGSGVVVQVGAAATMTGLVTEHTDGPGLLVSTGAEATCDACQFDSAGFAGVTLAGARLALSDVAIGPSRSDPQAGGGVGIHAGPSGEVVPELTLVGGEVEAGPYGGLWLIGDGAWTVDGATLHGGPGVRVGESLVVHGNAIYAQGARAWDGTRGLRVADATLRDARVAVLLDDATGSFDNIAWVDNTLDLQQQACDDDPAALPPSAAPTARICPLYDDVTVELRWSFGIVGTEVGTE